MTSRRYARLQVDADAIPDDDKPPQTGHTFNIWFLKWAGGDSNGRSLEPLKFRVDIKKDSGTTRGVEGKSPICLFFARGCCYKGRKCPFLHRLPLVSDQRIPTQDCFGRDKTADYRDDMGGVGLLQRSNRTLYVTGAHMNGQIQETISKQFLEFGAVDKIRVLPAKYCAFVSYRTEAEAQFAKEAMNGQSLDGNDVLTVKWANDDPNPNAQLLAKRDLEQAAMDTVKQLLGGVFENDANGENTRKRQKLHVRAGNATPKNEEGEVFSIQKDSTNGSSIDKAQGQTGLLDASRVSALKSLESRVPSTKTKVVENVPQPSTSGTVSSLGLALLAEYSSDEESG